MTEYQPRTVDRLIEILKPQDANPRSWQAEAASKLKQLRDGLRHMRVCAVCAEGDWRDCEGGRDALNALDESLSEDGL